MNSYCSRRISWSTFLKAHWRGLPVSDFFTVEVWSWEGLLTVYFLFVIDLATRRVTLCKLTTNPNEAWMLHWADSIAAAFGGTQKSRTGDCESASAEPSP